MSSSSSSSDGSGEAEASSEEGEPAEGGEDSQQPEEQSQQAEEKEKEEKKEKEEDGGGWSHLKGVIPSHEIERLRRDSVLRAQEEEKERIAEANVYVGKPDMPPSWSGGGWGGPKDGHDKDTRYMLRGSV